MLTQQRWRISTNINLLLFTHFITYHRGHGLSLIRVKSKRSDVVECIELNVFDQAFHGLVHSFLEVCRSDNALSKLHAFGYTLISCRLIFGVVVSGTIFDIMSLFVAPIAGITVWWDTSSARVIITIIIIILIIVSTTIISLKWPLILTLIMWGRR